MESNVVDGKKLAQVIDNYLTSENFSKPLVIFGHSGIGKTAIVNREVEKLGKKCYPITVYFPTGDPIIPSKDKNRVTEVSFLSHKDVVEHLDNILNYVDSMPVIIEVTVDYLELSKQIIIPCKDKIQWVYYLESVEDWLKWAREVSNNGYQFVDEIVCAFIEQNTMSFSSALVRETESEQLAQDYCKKSDTFPQRVCRWSPKEWQCISEAFLSCLQQLFVENQIKGTKESSDEKFKACFREEKRVYGVDLLKEGKTYIARNLDYKLLSKQLNSVDERVWYRWSLGKYSMFDATQNLRKNDRLGFLMGWLGEIIKIHTGTDNVPAKQWELYYNHFFNKVE